MGHRTFNMVMIIGTFLAFAVFGGLYALDKIETHWFMTGVIGTVVALFILRSILLRVHPISDEDEVM